MWGPSGTRRIAVLALIAVAACVPTFGASRGTMPPPGPDGRVDPASVPDFVEAADEAGWVPKRFLLDPVRDDEIPVFGDDLTTLVGHLVPGKGFVPLGADPAAAPARPVIAGPSDPAAPDGPGFVLYVRNATAKEAWIDAWPSDPAGAIAFTGGTNVGCYAVAPDAELMLFDRAPQEPGAVPVLPVVQRVADGFGSGWVDIAADGSVSTGIGVPAWWVDAPLAC
jgi:hypothetical protein